MPATKAGTVHLVGAGPGDPELLTLKALRLLRSADIVVYDRLVSAEVLDLVPAATERVFVGKMRGCHPVPQARINDILIQLARAGLEVVRLKGGDPFIFGRGCEELEHLTRHGIACQVVPGITAASGCAAAAAVPLTHRGLASSVRFVTGHCRDGQDLDLNWASLADPDTTLVIYMGLANIETMSQRLVEAGLSAETPAVAIACGTTAEQRLCRADLGGIAARVAEAELRAPVLMIVGRVAALARDDAEVDTAPVQAGAFEPDLWVDHG
jgi:uroporphyrin-III C-methyltransferase